MKIYNLEKNGCSQWRLRSAFRQSDIPASQNNVYSGTKIQQHSFQTPFAHTPRYLVHIHTDLYNRVKFWFVYILFIKTFNKYLVSQSILLLVGVYILRTIFVNLDNIGTILTGCIYIKTPIRPFTQTLQIWNISSLFKD